MNIQIQDKNVLSVMAKFKERSEAGIKKYKTTLERTDLSTLEWLTHAQEEAMDFVLYLERLKHEYKQNKQKMYKQRNYFYVISSRNTTTTIVDNIKLPTCPQYKFGITNNITLRKDWIKKEFNVKDIEVIYLKKYKNAKDLEDYIKNALYDKWEKQKEWFGENKTYNGTICKLKTILNYIEFYNNN